MTFQRLVISVFLLSTLVCAQQIFEKNFSNSIGKYCVGCICEAVSYCDEHRKCIGQACGSFAITRDYWIDAGNITINNESPLIDQAWTRCLNNLECASEVLQAYMRKYARDCNGDGEITCADFARLHHLGPNRCNGPLEHNYEKVYNSCESRLKNLI